MADEREIGVNDVMSSTFHYYPPQSGWTCFNCGGFVPNGCTHYCPTFAATPPRTTWVQTNCVIAHDFAVGPTHAICNRCKEVVALETKEAE